jgi:chitin disaccharide deacetylase
MNPNPLLKKLGLSNDDRAVILHADDIGMCQASIDAYADLVDFGLISSAATMVPCAWFPATAIFCREHAAKVDMGVHVTLNSEWNPCRWRPISTSDPASGLVDDEGYFHRELESTRDQADADAIYTEIKAQVSQALNAGIDVTHIDSHMFAIGQRPDFFQSYMRVAMEHQLPSLLLRVRMEAVREMVKGQIEDDSLVTIAHHLQELENQGLPMVDNMQVTSLHTHENRLEHIKEIIDSFEPGTINYFIIHPVKDTPEIRMLATDWRARVADYRTFTSEKARALFHEAGIHLIGWRVLRDLMRAAG